MEQTPYSHLSHAPITEALLDINVDELGEMSGIETFVKEVSKTHPTSDLIQTAEYKLPKDLGPSPHSKITFLGNICWNAERTRAVQARTDGFTVNHVKHYESWEVLREEAQRWWGIYSLHVRPKRVVKLGLRYINQLSFDVGTELDQQMKTYPHISLGLPQMIENFFMRIEIPFSPTRSARLTQTLVPEPKPTSRGMIFDIHAVSLQEFDPGSPDIWTELDQLRKIKNKCFFDSLHEGTWRKYK